MMTFDYWDAEWNRLPFPAEGVETSRVHEVLQSHEYINYRVNVPFAHEVGRLQLVNGKIEQFDVVQVPVRTTKACGCGTNI